jgi:hypothetical protein
VVKSRRILSLVFLLVVLPLLVYAVLKVTNFFGKAFGDYANLYIDLGSSYPVSSDSWKNLAQGGEEKGRMLASVADKLKGLNPDYIRIDHVFDLYNVVGRDGSGALTFNWSELDLTLGDIREIGAKPFIAISYMPPAISKGDILEVPNSWAEWELAVQRLVEHISGKGGLNISGVYYEVWNEPDLFGKFKAGGDKNYFDLYVHTAAGVGRASGANGLKVGGPATTALYDSWFNGLLKLKKSGVRVDFLSWHTYTKDLDRLEKDILNAKKWLSKYPGFENMELIISEIGPNSENDPAYDNSFGAINLLATAATIEGSVDRMFIFEIKDGPGTDKYWGRWGLFTNDKFGSPEEKPRVSAIRFLNGISGRKLAVAGQGSWVKAFAREGGGRIKTLVVNYDTSGKHSEAVPITFANLPSLEFTLKRTDYGGGVSEEKVATSSASWKTLQEFKPNSAAIFEIIPVK